MRRLFSATLVIALSVFLMTACDTYNDNASTKGSETTAKMTDSELENAIESKIKSDSQLNAAGIDVSANADRNEVTLSGTVESQDLRMKAVNLAKSVRSDLVITDKIDVKPSEITRESYTDEMARRDRERGREMGDKIGTSLDDAWIHNKIVTKLAIDSTTPQRKINVDVNNQVVTLRGDVDAAEEKAEAERIARETEGVKRVINQLKVNSVAKK
jgi:osmotically-inducible protein OsmY